MARNTQIGKLRDKAASLALKGKHRKALDVYEQLAVLESSAGIWPRREGEMHRRLGANQTAIEAFGRSCIRYADLGFVVKAVAMCKMILRIDPSQSEAQERLVSFNTERGFAVEKAAEPVDPSSAPRPPSSVSLPSAPPIGAEALGVWCFSSEKHRTASSGSVISSGCEANRSRKLALNLFSTSFLEDRAEGATPRMVNGEPSGIVEIPLERADDFVTESGSHLVAKNVLTRTPLFEELSPASFSRLIEKVEFMEVTAGEVVFRKGDTGTTLYVVVEGRISILDDDIDGDPNLLGELKSGDFFGELGLVTKHPRNATARALLDSELLAIDRRLIAEMIQEESSVLTVLLRFLRDRLVQNLVRSSALFAPFASEQRLELVSRFRFLEVSADTVLIAQGQESPALYIVLAGDLEATRAHETGAVELLGTLGSGDLFGEMSLLAQDPAVASVRATSRCLLLELPRDVFRETIMTHPQVLAVVGDLATERARQLKAVAGGEEKYEELHLDLI